MVRSLAFCAVILAAIAVAPVFGGDPQGTTGSFNHTVPNNGSSTPVLNGNGSTIYTIEVNRNGPVEVELVDNASGETVGESQEVANGNCVALTPTSGQSIRLTDANSMNQKNPTVVVHYTT
jgi:hypothetical protein